MTVILAIKISSAAIYTLLEYWLGKTKKVKANSALELVLTTSLDIIKVIRKNISDQPEIEGEQKP